MHISKTPGAQTITFDNNDTEPAFPSTAPTSLSHSLHIPPIRLSQPQLLQIHSLQCPHIDRPIIRKIVWIVAHGTHARATHGAEAVVDALFAEGVGCQVVFAAVPCYVAFEWVDH
jgi:hypothetical protein